MNLDFPVNGKSVSITTSHKNLGASFSIDTKWSAHVENRQKVVYLRTILVGLI